MRLITKQQLAEDAPIRWAAQYDITRRRIHGHERASWPADVYEALCTEPKLTPERVAEIIGNGSWTKLECEECQQDVERAVQIGETLLCEDCVRRATALFG